MQQNFSIDLAEHFHNLICKCINPRQSFTITEKAKINTKVLKLKGVTNSLLIMLNSTVYEICHAHEAKMSIIIGILTFMSMINTTY